MIAKVSSPAEPPVYELLDAPHSLVRQAKCARQPENPDLCGPHASGCGIASVANGRIVIEKRGPDENWDRTFQEYVRGVSSELIIAHNRKATPGLRIDRSCSHPFLRTFKGREVALCHNGSILTFESEAKQRGVADSEIFLEQILAGISELTAEDLARQVSMLAREHRYTSMSALLLTPERIFAWRIHSTEPASAERYSKYYTLYRYSSPTGALIASEPVDSDAGWELAPNGAFYTLSAAPAGASIEHRMLQI